MIPAWLFRQRRMVVLLAVALACAGLGAIRSLPVAMLPAVAYPRLVVEVDAGDQPAERMAVSVTSVFEHQLRSLPGMRSVRSITSRGSADISVLMDWSADMDIAALRAQGMVNTVLPDMPGVTATVRRMDPTVFPCIALALRGSTVPLATMRAWAIDHLQPALGVVDGVASVAVVGAQPEELTVAIDPERARAHGLSVDAIANALRDSVLDSAVGRLQDDGKLALVVVAAQPRDPQALGAVVVGMGVDGPVRLAAVADIRRDAGPREAIVAQDGHPAISVEIYQQPSGNTVAIAAAVRQCLAELQPQLPAGVEMATWYDQSDLIRASTASVERAVLAGIGLAAIIILAALRSWRAALVAGVSVPAALACTLLGLRLCGESINLMTLGGMAAAVGLIIDDAIVVVEHLARRGAALAGLNRDQGRTALIAAAWELASPMVGSTCASILIVVPLACLGGIAGSFFAALAITMAIALALSLVIAMAALPLASGWLHHVGASAAAPSMRSTAAVDEAQADVPRPTRLGRAYRGLMERLLRHHALVLLAILPLGCAGYLAYTHLGTGFLPEIDEGGFTLDYRADPGTSLTATDALAHRVEAILLAIPEVASVSRRTAGQLGGGVTESNAGDMFVRLKAQPRRPIQAVIAEARARVNAQVPELDIDVSQLMEDMIGDLVGNPHPVEIVLSGADQADLTTAAHAVARMAASVPGVVDVNDGVVIAGDALTVRVDAVAAGAVGLTPAAIADQLKASVGSEVVASITGVRELVGVRVWTLPSARVGLRALESLPIRAGDGHAVALGRLASIERVAGQPQIDHQDLQRVVAVTARISGMDLGSAIAALEARLRAPGALGLGISFRMEGLYAQQQQAFHDLVEVLIGAVVLLLLLLVGLYRSLRLALALLLTSCLSMAGVTMGLWMTGTELTISALMGMTMVVGIVTEVGILYASALATLPAQEPLEWRVVRAGEVRLRPILMTVAAAVLALLPLACAGAGGAELQRPLAIAIISGLLLQLPLALVVLPVLVSVLKPRLGTAASAST